MQVYSCKYGTFLVNNCKEREEKKLILNTISVWTEVNQSKKRFHNPLYELNTKQIIPCCSAKKLQFWDNFFLRWESSLAVQEDIESKVAFLMLQIEKKQNTLQSFQKALMRRSSNFSGRINLPQTSPSLSRSNSSLRSASNPSKEEITTSTTNSTIASSSSPSDQVAQSSSSSFELTFPTPASVTLPVSEKPSDRTPPIPEPTKSEITLPSSSSSSSSSSSAPSSLSKKTGEGAAVAVRQDLAIRDGEASVVARRSEIVCRLVVEEIIDKCFQEVHSRAGAHRSRSNTLIHGLLISFLLFFV